MSNSKKLGEVDLNEDAMFINDSLEDLWGEDNVLEQNDDQDNRLPDQFLPTNEEEEEDVEYNEEDDEEDDGETDSLDEEYEEEVDLSSYNDLALLAMSIKDQDPSLFNFDISPDMSAEEFAMGVRTNLSSVQQAIAENIENQYGEAAKYLNMILQGAGNVVNTSLEFHKIGAIELSGDEEDSELEDIVSQYLTRKGTPQEDVSDLIDVYKSKGVLLEKAQESINFHKQLEDQYIQNWYKERQLQEQQFYQLEQQYNNAIKNHINKGQVKGLPIRDPELFEEALFRPTHLIETFDDAGRKIVKKVPLLSVKVAQFQQDLEQQLAFQLLLLNDFDFTEIAQQQKRKINNNLLDVLNDRSGRPSSRKKNSNYFDE